MNQATLRTLVGGRACVVVGAAPLLSPLVVATSEYVVAVNGGISSAPRVDAWVLNSRTSLPPSWGMARRTLGQLMLRQGADRQVPLLILLTKDDDASVVTPRVLRAQGTEAGSVLEVGAIERTDIEVAAGARTGDMSKHALSAGLFAVALLFWAGAATVRLEGISWVGGYAYTDTPVIRGHLVGDQLALVRLLARHADALIHTLPLSPRQLRSLEHLPMATARATTPTPPRSAPDAVVRVRATRLGYYDLARRRPGDVFQLRSARHFSDKWMEQVEASTPTQTLSPSGALRREHQAILSGKSPRLQPNAADLVEDDAPVGASPGPRSSDAGVI